MAGKAVVGLVGSLLVAGVLAGTTASGAPALAAPPLPPGVYEPDCVLVIESGDSLSLIVDRLAIEGVNVETLQAENGIDDPDQINEGSLLDFCINQIDDVTGQPRTGDAPSPDPATLSGVEAQQAWLNQFFAGTGMPELAVDGDSGPLTRQQLCAARLVLGMPISRDNLVPGSPDEQALMAAAPIAIPPAPTGGDPDRWVVIDKTCQVLVAGEGSSGVRFVFPASTGEVGHETRDQQDASAFRYDPALDNGGWHDSSVYPSAADNPLNGNMYRPIYFDRGQAIHGANNVPPSPASKGCVRLRVVDQDQLVAWLGLADATGPVWTRDRINLRVTVHGQYVP